MANDTCFEVYDACMFKADSDPSLVEREWFTCLGIISIMGNISLETLLNDWYDHGMVAWRAGAFTRLIYKRFIQIRVSTKSCSAHELTLTRSDKKGMVGNGS